MENQLKQKQIEEMAKIVLEKAFENYETSGSVEIDTEVRRNFYYAFLAYGEELYDRGVRKIPEGAVVLTREEYQTANYWRERAQMWKKSAHDIRKETAEKFAERVKMAFYYEFDELIPSIMADKIDEICKEITDNEVQNGN